MIAVCDMGPLHYLILIIHPIWSSVADLGQDGLAMGNSVHLYN